MISNKHRNKGFSDADKHYVFRSGGDVLQDIGTMLSDLTDELDAMLNIEGDSD